MSSSSGVRDLICKSEVPATIPFGKSSALAALLQYDLVTAHFEDELLVLLISTVEQSWKVETNLSITTVVVEEDAACSLTKTLLRKRVSTTMTVDNVTILGCQKYLVNLLPSCTCDCSLLISVGESEQFNGDCRRSFLISIIDILLNPDFCFLLHCCACDPAYNSSVSSSQHSASHKQLHLCSKTKTQTQTKTKTKTGQNTRKTLCKRKMVEPILYFNVLFCNKFSHCETNRGGHCISSLSNKQTNKPTNQPISFYAWVLHKGKFIQAFLAGPHKES
jgi:hypothetical protein